MVLVMEPRMVLVMEPRMVLVMEPRMVLVMEPRMVLNRSMNAQLDAVPNNLAAIKKCKIVLFVVQPSVLKLLPMALGPPLLEVVPVELV
jgi:hypothetical protein